MLTVACEEVALDPIKVRRNDTVEEVKKVLKPNIPVFIIEEPKVGVVAVRFFDSVSRDEKMEKLATWVEPIDGEEPLYRAAQIMVSQEVLAVPVKTEEGIKGVTHKIVLGALKSTKELAKREARTVTSDVPVISERRLQNIENVASKSGARVIPVVNEERKLVGVWIDGKLTRRPSVVREGTRIRLVVDKVLKNPVVVINKWREPVGVITIWDLLDLAASYREFTVPTFYSGLEALSELDREYVKGLVEKMLRRLTKSVNVFYVSMHVKKRGMWNVRIKVSTPLRMFTVNREGVEAINVIREALEVIEQDILEEKKKRTEWKKMLRE